MIIKQSNTISHNLLVLLDHSGLKKILNGGNKNLGVDKDLLSCSIKDHGFKANKKQTLKINFVKGKKLINLVLIGFGKNIDDSLDFREMGAAIAKHLKGTQTHWEINTGLLENLKSENLKDLTESLLLSDYHFEKFKQKSTPRKEVSISFAGRVKLSTKQIAELKAVKDASFFARDLVNTPPNICTPAYVTRIVKQRLGKSALKITVFNKNQLKKMSANLLLAVAQGSDQAPYLLRISYKPLSAKAKNKKILALVGKGVTYDSGGLSIKTGAGMMTMKCDMAGAAAVIATMEIISKLKPDREVRAYVPLTENMINGSATRPGDIFKGMNGKTVEILNTDAEGRLILTDAMTLAEKEGASEMVSVATLTGACMVALGNLYAGHFSNNKNLEKRIQDAANEAGELIWPLPLAKEYRDQLKSSVADLKNIGSGGFGGAITAALFLEHAINKAAWSHLDIAGPAFLDSAYLAYPRGGTGFGIRTLVELTR